MRERERSGGVIQATSVERRTYHRNIVFGVSNGALTMLADTLLHPIIVLALFVSQITGSNILVGLVPAIAYGIWFLPQLLATATVQDRSRKLPFVVWPSVIRTLSILALALIGFAATDREPSFILTAFFVVYAIYNLASGFANVPMVEIASHAIPGNRRGMFFGQRGFWGGVLAFMAGFLIQRVLSDPGDFPANFAVLFFGAFVALAVATYSAVRLVEPSPPVYAERTDVLAQILDAPHFLANRSFRRFLAFRSFLSVGAIADPFYVVYVQQELNAPPAIIGIYIAAMTLARFGSTLVWSRLADQQGNRLVLQLSALIRMAMPVFALALPPMLGWGPIADRVPGGEQALYYAFGLVFVAYGVALSGQNLANMTYVLDIAPLRERTACAGLTNIVLGVVAFVPVIGGAIVDRFGFDFLFMVAFFIALAAVMSSGLLHEPRVTGSAYQFPRVRVRPRRDGY